MQTWALPATTFHLLFFISEWATNDHLWLSINQSITTGVLHTNLLCRLLARVASLEWRHARACEAVVQRVGLCHGRCVEAGDCVKGAAAVLPRLLTASAICAPCTFTDNQAARQGSARKPSGPPAEVGTWEWKRIQRWARGRKRRRA